MICFFRTKPTLTGSTGPMVDRGQDSSTSHQHSPGLQAGAFSCPHSKEHVTAPLMQEKQTSPGDLQTPFKMFSNPFCTSTCVSSQKKRNFSGADFNERRWNWPSLASSSCPLTPYWLGHAAPFDWHSDCSPPATNHPWKWINASPSPFISFFQFMSALRKKFRLRLIRYSSKRRQRP